MGTVASHLKNDESLAERVEEVQKDSFPFYCKQEGKLIYKRPGDWIRPLGSAEIYNAEGSFVGLCNTAQMIWLSSKKPLEEDIFREAVNDLIRLHSCLQVYVSRKRSRLWFRRVRTVTADVQFCSGSPMDIFHREMNEYINIAQEPIWKVRLIRAQEEDSSRGEIHKYAILFVLPHVITDATTNFNLCSHLVMLMSKCNDGTCAGNIPYHPMIPVTKEPLGRILTANASRYFCWRIFHACLLSSLNRDLGLEWLCHTISDKTFVLRKELSEEMTQNLLRMCKKEKVTVNSCLCALINLAFWKMSVCHSGSKTRKVYVNCLNLVNTRRYNSEENKDCDGCCVSALPLRSRVDITSHRSFWEDARKITSDVHHGIQSRDPLISADFLPVFNCVYRVNRLLSSYGRRHFATVHYLTSSMGNVDSSLLSQKTNDVIKIYDMFRSVSNPNAFHTLTIAYQTFRGKFSLTVDVLTSKVKPELGQELFDCLSGYLDNLSETGSI